MSELKTTISELPKGLTTCQSIVRDEDYQDNINFLVNNAISRLEFLKSYGQPQVDNELSVHMEYSAPRYTASLDDNNIAVVRKIFMSNSHYKSTPLPEYYQTFKEAVVSNGFATDDYFNNYEQSRLEIVQNIIADNGIASIRYEEGNFCLLRTSSYKHVQCVGDTGCIRVDSVSTYDNSEL